MFPKVQQYLYFTTDILKGAHKRYYDETNGLFPPTETETDSHKDYCTTQVFPLVWRQIPIPLLKYSKIGTEICP